MDRTPTIEETTHKAQISLLPSWQINLPFNVFKADQTKKLNFPPTMLNVLVKKIKLLMKNKPITGVGLMVVMTIYAILVASLFPSSLIKAHGSFVLGFGSLALGDDLFRSFYKLCVEGEKIMNSGQISSNSVSLTNWWNGFQQLDEGQVWVLWWKWGLFHRSFILFLNNLKHLASPSTTNSSTVNSINTKKRRVFLLEGFNAILLSSLFTYTALKYPDNRLHTVIPKQLQYLGSSLLCCYGISAINHSFNDNSSWEPLPKWIALYLLTIGSYMGTYWSFECVYEFIDLFQNKNYSSYTTTMLFIWYLSKLAVSSSVGVVSTFALLDKLKIWKTLGNYSDKLLINAKKYQKEFSAIGLSTAKGLGLYSFAAGSYNFVESMKKFIQHLLNEDNTTLSLGMRAKEMGKDVLFIAGMYAGFYIFNGALCFGSPYTKVPFYLENEALNLTVGGVTLHSVVAALSKFSYFYNKKILDESTSLSILATLDNVLSYENIALTFATSGTFMYANDLLLNAYDKVTNSSNQIRPVFNPVPGGISLSTSLSAVALKHFLSAGSSVLGAIGTPNQSIVSSLTSLGLLLPLSKDLVIGTCSLAASGFVLMKTFPSLKPLIEKPLQFFDKIIGRRSRKILSILGSPQAAFTLFATIGSYIIYKKYIYDEELFEQTDN
ncbi:predicted protein [Naegleria gruberi]|uniref:Predicted protein n=1 Tax=Naegleria gruberi TaxID=5762 RepID=D2UXE3_NAEGR|nr:uncharacterized protein NAEGRDRAFT_61092 [Naegleria gruberi]EFC50271.1 predicted protein [Naegleria gruberi]|eukprot:XP_002683015.1 predicted protein [Naegleria gruberi strain NEG-M]